MYVQFAVDFIPRRMKELGYGDDYLTRWRQFQVDKNATLEIDAPNEFYYLINPPADFRVKSKFGVFDLRDETITEQYYEHKGKISIINTSDVQRHILFIQVIPIHRKKK